MMTKRILTSLLYIFLIVSPLSFAHPESKCKDHCKKKVPSAWDGTNAQVGYTMNRGNTESSMMNLGLNLIYKKPHWSNTFQGLFQYGKQDHVANRQYLQLNDQAQFNLSNAKKSQNYIFVNNNYFNSKFGPYAYQNVSAAGYGRDWVDTKHFKLSAQLGPGFRRSRVQNENETEDTAIGTLQSNMSLMLGDYGTLTQSVLFNLAKPYNYLQTVTAFTNKIVSHIAVQISYTITYYSEIPSTSSNTKKMDTVTNISLVYNL